ncbi:MAG: hypothetical protein COW18_13290 [Zetaproteobacteria bacterium CG12_big_fil_rev_8_21_14_0_65_54_13]|nr:MAG: hypothetical protein COX55_10590 [Zetaproteobacteria bacterium CG23_combo_of_CG06-09_8_20_14_all_54_7]PIW44379.1 MAG: hypothetical protein COW18_13290 [Zetaproteobacteria bacterium CG12_big_fil_rev_8_21_14_0_65_54_13]PJA30176.1 MAG: hypothetical protein CO188_04295 [Zetaproteobacteria bacterium CG_4_9_14_3_um_filter_54_145]
MLMSLGFLLQVFAISPCQMGVAEATVFSDHLMQHGKQTERGCLQNGGMNQSLMDDAPMPGHSHGTTPCVHCSQPDELVSSAQLSNVATPVLSLSSCGYMPGVMHIGSDRIITFTAYAPSLEPPGNVPLIYRTTLRLRI